MSSYVWVVVVYVNGMLSSDIDMCVFTTLGAAQEYQERFYYNSIIFRRELDVDDL